MQIISEILVIKNIAENYFIIIQLVFHNTICLKD